MLSMSIHVTILHFVSNFSPHICKYILCPSTPLTILKIDFDYRKSSGLVFKIFLFIKERGGYFAEIVLS